MVNVINLSTSNYTISVCHSYRQPTKYMLSVQQIDPQHAKHI